MGSAVFGVISPHPPIFVPGVGGQRAETAHASLSALRQVGEVLGTFAPETIVLISPHAPGSADSFAVDESDVFEGSLEQFGDHTTYRYPGDPELAAALLGELKKQGVPAISRFDFGRLRPGWLDHATIVPLSFIEPSGTVPLIVLSLSYLSYGMHRELGRLTRTIADSLGRRVAFVASGDLSHRLTTDAPAGYSPRARELDAQIVGLVEQGRLSGLMELDPDLVDAGGECGLRSLIALGGFCCEDPAPTKVLAYEGPWGVGYLTALVGRAAVEGQEMGFPAGHETGFEGGLAGRDESEIVALARRAIAAELGADTPAHDVVLSDPSLPSRAGAFVSLHRGGVLRGCIGTILPVHDTLATEVVHNAIEAAFHDPRFPALERHELGDLEVKVDVLRPPESCTLEDLDPSKYGVIVSSGWRRGLLLPDLEGVDDVDAQVRIAMQKAGIRPGEPCGFERFRVERYT